MIRQPPRSTQSRSSAASDVYKRQDRSAPHNGQYEAEVVPIDRSAALILHFRTSIVQYLGLEYHKMQVKRMGKANEPDQGGYSCVQSDILSAAVRSRALPGDSPMSSSR